MWFEKFFGPMAASCLGFLIVTAVFAFGGSLVAQWLWNCIIAVKFGLPEFTYLEMCGVMVMLRLLFPSITFSRKS